MPGALRGYNELVRTKNKICEEINMNGSLIKSKSGLEVLGKSENGATNYFFYTINGAKGCDYYAVEVCEKESSALEVIGKELDYASAVYEKIVNGEVSSTTLCDVVHDAVMSKKY